MNRMLGSMKPRCASLALLLFTGCASQHRQFVPFPDQHVRVEDPDKARIYVLSDPPFFNFASYFVRVSVFDGGKGIGTIALRHGFLSWEREPGEVTIEAVSSAGGNRDGVKLTVAKGVVSYVLARPERRFDLPRAL